MAKRKNRNHTNKFKQEAVALALDQGYTVPKALSDRYTNTNIGSFKLGI